MSQRRREGPAPAGSFPYSCAWPLAKLNLIAMRFLGRRNPRKCSVCLPQARDMHAHWAKNAAVIGAVLVDGYNGPLLAFLSHPSPTN